VILRVVVWPRTRLRQYFEVFPGFVLVRPKAYVYYRRPCNLMDITGYGEGIFPYVCFGRVCNPRHSQYKHTYVKLLIL
jgi:hypothetical protein